LPQRCPSWEAEQSSTTGTEVCVRCWGTAEPGCKWLWRACLQLQGSGKPALFQALDRLTVQLWNTAEVRRTAAAQPSGRGAVLSPAAFLSVHASPPLLTDPTTRPLLTPAGHPASGGPGGTASSAAGHLSGQPGRPGGALRASQQPGGASCGIKHDSHPYICCAAVGTCMHRTHGAVAALHCWCNPELGADCVASPSIIPRQRSVPGA